MEMKVWFTEYGRFLNLSEIEKEVGCPANTLRKYLKGERGISERWIPPVVELLKRMSWTSIIDCEVKKDFIEQQVNVVLSGSREDVFQREGRIDERFTVSGTSDVLKIQQSASIRDVFAKSVEIAFAEDKPKIIAKEVVEYPAKPDEAIKVKKIKKVKDIPKALKEVVSKKEIMKVDISTGEVKEAKELKWSTKKQLFGLVAMVEPKIYSDGTYFEVRHMPRSIWEYCFAKTLEEAREIVKSLK